MRAWVDDLDGLLGLAQMDAVELHPWNATLNYVERADRTILDLDLGESVGRETVIEPAPVMRGVLRPKAWRAGQGDRWNGTASDGFAVESKEPRRCPALPRSVAERLVQADRERYLLSAAPTTRKGRIFIDYLRNGRGNTAIGAFSPWARPGFPIARPLTWAQVERGMMPDAFTTGRPFRQLRRR